MRPMRMAAVLSFMLITSFSATAPEPVGAADKNPCSMKDMKKGQIDMRAMPAPGIIPIRKMAIKDPVNSARRADALWMDASLGTSGFSCSTCHPGGAGLKNTPWPKFISMADDTLTVDQMINFCMTNPMKAKPLAWNSQKMTLLAKYIAANAGKGGEVVTPVPMKDMMKNPCHTEDKMGNPCGMK
jgi:hypothetical protein